jgi:hypothetical protein
MSTPQIINWYIKANGDLAGDIEISEGRFEWRGVIGTTSIQKAVDKVATTKAAFLAISKAQKKAEQDEKIAEKKALKNPVKKAEEKAMEKQETKPDETTEDKPVSKKYRIYIDGWIVTMSSGNQYLMMNGRMDTYFKAQPAHIKRLAAWIDSKEIDELPDSDEDEDEDEEDDVDIPAVKAKDVATLDDKEITESIYHDE